MRPLALLLCLWAGAANADWQIWSLEDASQILDCAVVIEMFEAPDGEALPTDFAAAAEALRASVAMYHGDTFVRQVGRERRDYWSRKPSFDRADAADLWHLLPECAKWVEGHGY